MEATGNQEMAPMCGQTRAPIMNHIDRFIVDCPSFEEFRKRTSTSPHQGQGRRLRATHAILSANRARVSDRAGKGLVAEISLDAFRQADRSLIQQTIRENVPARPIPSTLPAASTGNRP
jgi:hypothetical protein